MSPEPAPEEATQTPREDLLNRTRTDPDLGPKERETTLRFAADEDTAAVYSEEAAIIRRLLSHGEATVDALGIHADGTTRTLPFDEARRAVGPDALVVTLRGSIPLRYLGVSTGDGGRSHDKHAPVVSKGVFDE
jgi:hypothetical protein